MLKKSGERSTSLTPVECAKRLATCGVEVASLERKAGIARRATEAMIDEGERKSCVW